MTDRRVMLKPGTFTTNVQEIKLDAIEGSLVNQGVFGRIFDYGNLTIRGRGDSEVAFPTMADPGTFRAKAEHLRREAEMEPAQMIAEEIEDSDSSLFSETSSFNFQKSA